MLFVIFETIYKLALFCCLLTMRINAVRNRIRAFVFVPASAVPDNWCPIVGLYNAEKMKDRRQPWEQRSYSVKETCRQLLGCRNLQRLTSTTTTTATRETTITSLLGH